MLKENPRRGELYQHKNGEVYEVIFMATSAWDVHQELVVYKQAGDKYNPLPVWVRSLTEFSDGRFTFVGKNEEICPICGEKKYPGVKE